MTPSDILDKVIGVTITYTKSHTYITHKVIIDGVTITYTESYACSTLRDCPAR